MQDKSEPDSEARRLSIPRGLLLAWLWINVPATILQWKGCVWPGHEQACERIGNTVGNLFGLLPMTLMMIFPASTPLLLRVAVPVAVTGVCHWLARRFLRPRIGPLAFAAIVVVWLALSWLTFFGALFLPG